MTFDIQAVKTAERLEPDANYLILIDAHVHIYDCFDIEKLLDSAWNSFHNHALQHTLQGDFTGLLLLTETSEHNWFAELSAKIALQTARQMSLGKWKFVPTAEDFSLFASGPHGQKIFLIAGRQIVTAEKLEVLALITHRTFTDGLSLEATIHVIQAAGGIVVLPWAVGKWLGKRGKLIHQMIRDNHESPIFLGDNSGRPQFWRPPSQFKTIEQQGRPVLRGTDPLPLSSETTRPGNFGLALAAKINVKEPGKHLKALLLDPEAIWQPYGTLETFWRFLKNQLAIRGYQ